MAYPHCLFREKMRSRPVSLDHEYSVTSSRKVHANIWMSYISMQNAFAELHSGRSRAG